MEDLHHYYVLANIQSVNNNIPPFELEHTPTTKNRATMPSSLFKSKTSNKSTKSTVSSDAASVHSTFSSTSTLAMDETTMKLPDPSSDKPSSSSVKSDCNQRNGGNGYDKTAFITAAATWGSLRG